MSLSSSPSATTTKTVFDSGKYTTLLLKVDSEKKCTTSDKSSLSPPKPLLIATPSDTAGEFSLLILLHGYLLNNSFYSQLIQHVASHGFIVIAPQLYCLAGTDATEEIKSTAEITSWLSQGLKEVLPPHVHPNLNKIALSGHSRGGKSAFALALGKIVQASSKFSALIGVDPIDGTGKGNQTPPPVLTYKPNSFDLNIPVLVIGSGLGEIKKNPFFPACAPKGVNHEDFYNECCAPACYFVAKDYGHLDMLDDKTMGIKGLATCFCKHGKTREPMRRFVGGIIVAFLKAYLDGDSSDLEAIRYGHEKAPLELQKVDFLDSDSESFIPM